MTSDLLLIVASVSAACGNAALRFAWSRPRRSTAWNAGGWGLLALSVLAGWTGAGAWGVAVACLWGMGAAMLLLAHAAWTSPVASGAKASNRRVNMLPQPGEPLRLGGRILTFLIVAILAMIVSIGVSVALRALLFLSGMSEANAAMMAFFAMPLVWTWLCYALLMEEGRAAQWRMLSIYAVPGLIMLGMGIAA